jgi:DegV family protein with EDD domain
MKRVAVVTDSASDLDPASVEALGVAVIALEAHPPDAPPDPVEVCFEPPTPRGGVMTVTRVEVDPLTESFVRTYERLAEAADGIISVHVSARLSGACAAARCARERLRGLLPIEVVDSGAAGIQLGFIVRRIAQAAGRGATLAELELLTRRASANVHAMFFAESLDQISRSPRWGRDRAWPIHGNGTRPLLYVEDGELKPLERVRTKARGYDRLAEFVELFPHVDALAIVHDLAPAEVELVLRRIAPLYPRDRIIFGAYGPTLRSQLGPHAIGVSVDQGIGGD